MRYILYSIGSLHFILLHKPVILQCNSVSMHARRHNSLTFDIIVSTMSSLDMRKHTITFGMMIRKWRNRLPRMYARAYYKIRLD